MVFYNLKFDLGKENNYNSSCTVHKLLSALGYKRNPKRFKEINFNKRYIFTYTTGRIGYSNDKDLFTSKKHRTIDIAWINSHLSGGNT